MWWLVLAASCVLSAAVARAATQLVRRSLARPDFSIYHREDELMAKVKDVVSGAPHLEMMTMHRENAAGNYTADVEVVSVAPRAPDNSSSLRLLLDFGEHARELISSEVGLRVLQLLADEQALAAQLINDFSITEARMLIQLLRCCVSFKILPMENHGGRKIVEGLGDLCERKNGDHVDPNRNWEVDWGRKESDYTPYEEAPGSSPFSEPETQVVRDIAQSYKPQVWINVHSGMKGLFMPFDHRREIANGPHDDYTLRLLKQLNERSCQSQCVVGSGGASVGYLAHGTATDYMYLRAHIPVALTWEIFGDEKAAYNDCFRMFNPLTRESYDEEVRRWTNAVLTSVALMVEHPIVSELHLAGRSAAVDVSDIAALALHSTDSNRVFPASTSAHVEVGNIPVEMGRSGGGHVERERVESRASRSTKQEYRGMLASQQHGMGVMGSVFALALIGWCAHRAYTKPGRRRRRIVTVSPTAGANKAQRTD